MKTKYLIALSLLCGLGFSNLIYAQAPMSDLPSNEMALAVNQPQKVILFDFGTLDTLTQLGQKNKVLGLPKQSLPHYLSAYRTDQYADLGGLKSPNLEEIAALKPDLIVITGRQGKENHIALSQIAPTLKVNLDAENYLMAFKEHAMSIGRIFNQSEAVENALLALDQKIKHMHSKIAQLNKSALIVMHNDGKIFVVNKGVYAALIHDILGFKKVDINQYKERQPMNDAYLNTINPDYIFIIDRSHAIGAEKMKPELLETEAMKKISAYQNKKIMGLTPDLWYLSGGGLQSINLQLDEVFRIIEE